MAFTIRQGLEAVDAVMTTYDPAPVVLYESNIGSLFKFRYILQVDERKSDSTWGTIATIYRYPNDNSCGVFDMSSVLRNAFDYAEDANATPASNADCTTDVGNSAPFRIRLGYESATTESGAVTTTWETYKYIWAIHARHLDEFTSWSNRPMPDFVLNDNQAEWLTSRQAGNDTTLVGDTYTRPYVIEVNEDTTFSMSYLSTDSTTSTFNTDPMRLRLKVYSNGFLELNETCDLSNQEVGIDAFAGFNADGYVTREVHFGQTDLIRSTWSAFSNSTRWDHIVVYFEKTSDSTAVSKAVVLKKRACLATGVRFKFMNRFGGYDILHCQGHGAETTQYTRQTYATNTGNWYTATGLSDDTDLQLNNVNRRQQKSFVSKESRKLQARTGYLSTDENSVVHDLMRSPMVYATRFEKPRQKTGSLYFPVLLTGTSMKSMFQETDKLVEYTIDYEHSNMPRVQH